MIGTRNQRVACLVLLACCLAGSVEAQELTAVDDFYSIPFGLTLEVEPFGVLENDLLDGENAGESGATAVLVTDVAHGTLVFNDDGSFTYSVGAGFAGSDSFVYRAEFGAVSDEATVILSACDGGPDIYTCWDEDAFNALLETLDYSSVREGFEDGAVWGHIRTPDSAMSVISHGVEWHSNHPDPPASNPITTTSGAPHSGQWGVYDANHGYATGSAPECDIDDPPLHCRHHDGISGSRVLGETALHGVGGWFSGIYGAKMAIFIDGAGPYGGVLLTYGHDFIGIVDTRPAGFTEFEFRELDGKIGQPFYVWADDISLVGDFATGVATQEPRRQDLRILPNPARGSTSIRFNLETAASLRLEIYDLGGRLLRTLGNEERGSGTHASTWNLRDDAGRKVASGVYFARLSTTRAGVETVSSHKVVVVE